MTQLQLLSNGKYHVALTPSGGGRSQWNDLAITRWREDASLDGWGTFLCLRGEPTGTVWSAYDRPASLERGLRVGLDAAVARDDDVEWRRLRVANESAAEQRLSATSYAELVLAPAATDSAHPAFSKLFVVTEIDPKSGLILATRRSSAQGAAKLWVFHQAVARGESSLVSFETDRMCFVGRGRDLSCPDAMRHGNPLGGRDGSVLDPIASVRIPFRVAAGEACTIEWTTGVATSRDECIALARRYREVGTGDRILDACLDFRGAVLRRLGATDADAALFERLAGSVLIADPALRAPAQEIAQNRRGQSSLWAFGISGDVPIVLVQVASAAEIAPMQQLVQAHAFWTSHGLRTELMVLHGQRDSSLPERIRAVIDQVGCAGVVGKRDGIFLHSLDTVDEEDRILLRSAARIVVSGSGPGLTEQSEPLIPRAVPAAPRFDKDDDAVDGPAPEPSTELLAENGHGGFGSDGREYVMTVSRSQMTPLPWVNVIANPGFGSIVSEAGSASTWSENSHEFRLTPWSNDPVSDANTEAFYLRDEEGAEVWSPTLQPTRSDGAFVVTHGFGYSVFEHVEHGIDSTLRIHVAIDSPVKFSTLTLRNRSDRPRRLSVTSYVEWVLGDERAENAMHVATEFDGANNALFARNGYNTDFADRTAFLAADAEVDSVCGDRGDFFGIDGSRAAPAALAQTRLSGRVGAALDPCAALRVALALAPGEQREVVFRLGAGKTLDDARELVRSSAGRSGETLEAVHVHWRRTLGAVQVRTPEPALDALANGWLLYQVIGSRLWGRTAFYQSSGAYGFRDQLQDVMALVHARPELVREHLLLAASRQFEEGDVQHWWHPPSGKGIRTRCSDDYLWLPFATGRYVEVTGDVGVLDESCPFLKSRVLNEGEASNYELPSVGAEPATLYEHCRRAIEHSRRYGAHGLPLMGAGDWNDGMNLVGIGGKGESVWLAFFVIAVLKRFAPIARERGDGSCADACESEAAALTANVDASAWDGDWYLRAWFDDGTPLGSSANAECQIDSIAQSWSVLSGAAPPERAGSAMASLQRRLVRTDTRIVQLLDPPFDTSQPSPGYIEDYVPGVRENGGQYTHGAVWAALAFAALGDAEHAWQIYDLLDPVHHGDSAGHIAVYKTEPYVVAGDVYAFPPHAGRGGWSWYTGSAGWMYQLLVESLLGLQRRGNQLTLKPLLPRDWPSFELRYRLGATTFEIAVRVAAATDAIGLNVDGAELPGCTFTLIDDGAPHRVVLAVRREDPPARP
ncbi:MAG: hypothetical protein ABI809_02070 [Caldimonas sp.]